MSEEAEAPQHLSIGEVLALVQEEFPDVSISKIRFLESQGLIAPERTASGYRKFFEADIERLRWILRQQRDHFLPLKVIRKMLDQGVETTAGAESQPRLFADTDPSDDPTSPGAEDADALDAGAASTGGGPPGDAAESSGVTPRSSAHPAVASAPARREDADRGGSRTAGREPRHGHATPADVVAALQEGPAGRGGGATPRRRSVATAAMTATERLTRDELLEAAGLDEVQLEELERFGLLTPVTIGNSPTYDAEGLEVARLAVRYAALGVEARHLRMYKVAAEREVGFIEQLVVPLLKQRNPSARQQAVERVDELADMGAELHAALLRQRLGPVVGP